MTTPPLGTSTQTSRPTSAPSGVRGHTRRRKLAALLTTGVAMLTFLIASPVAPASASTAGTATVCFVHGNGSPYTYDQAAQYYTGNGWVNAAWSRSTNGCLRWTVASGRWWRFQAFYRVGTRYWMGTSQYAYVNPGAQLNYGTHYVYMY